MLNFLKKKQEYQYLNLLKKIISRGTKSEDRTGTGTFKLFGERLEFDLSRGQIPLLTTKKINYRLVVEELLWLLSGSTDVKKLQEKNVHIWDGNGSKEECLKFGRIEGDLGPIYGHQWRNFGAGKLTKSNSADYYCDRTFRWIHKDHKDNGTDQIKSIFDLILSNPNSRRIILSGWHPKEALEVNPPPCHTLYQFQVCDGKLNCALYSRSNDFFLGNPFNISSASTLTILIAHLCDLKPGKFVHFIGDCHLYLDHIEQAKIQLKRKPFSFPMLRLSNKLKGLGVSGLSDIKLSDFTLEGYKAHKTIKAKMSV